MRHSELPLYSFDWKLYSVRNDFVDQQSPNEGISRQTSCKELPITYFETREDHKVLPNSMH